MAHMSLGRPVAGTQAVLLKRLLHPGKSGNPQVPPRGSRPRFHAPEQTPKGRTHMCHVACSGLEVSLP